MKRDYRLLKISVYLGTSALILWMITHYWPAVEGFAALIVSAAAPLITGCVIAYAVNILMAFYEKHLPRCAKRPASRPSSNQSGGQTGRIWNQLKSRLQRSGGSGPKPSAAETSSPRTPNYGRRAVSLLLAVFSLLVIVALLLTIVIPELAAGVRLLAREAPPALEQLVDWITEQTTVNGESMLPEGVTAWLDALSLDTDGLLQWAISQLDHIVPAVVNVVSSVFSVVVSILLSAIFAVYLLCGKEKLAAQVNTLMDVYLKPRRATAIRHVLETLNECFHSYIVGQCLEALILGALCTLGMLIFRFPYAVMVGTLVGFTALIPIAGAYIGAFVGAFVIFTVDPLKALLFLVYIVVLQQIEGNVIYPRVVGTSLGLPGIWVLAAVMIGGNVAGVIGMLLGVPLCAALYKLLREDVHRRRAQSAAIDVPAEEASESTAPQ